MTETTETKLYKSLPQPNEDKPITVDIFSPLYRSAFSNS
ncbi:Uncharacterised protein [Citrobacter freundii]|nr:Uncharacterised protein [Citrobacter freundii]